MARYNQTERKGVNAAESIVINDLGWVFREQPIVDVGIDALIESTEKGNPSGKFIGLQIKTGLSNFHSIKKNLVYYITNVHYQYWINCSIPMILVAHIPERGKTYWQVLSKGTIEKTNTRWKLVIPLHQEFNSNAKLVLETLPMEAPSTNIFFYSEFGEEASFSELVESSTENFKRVEETVYNFGNLLDRLSQKLNEKTEKSHALSAQGLHRDSPEVIRHIASISTELNSFYSRVKPEIEIFAFSVTQAFGAHTVAFVELIEAEQSISDEIQSTFHSIKVVKSAIDDAIESITHLVLKANNLPEIFPVLKIAKSNFKEVLVSLVEEYEDARELCVTMEIVGRRALKKYLQ